MNQNSETPLASSCTGTHSPSCTRLQRPHRATTPSRARHLCQGRKPVLLPTNPPKDLMNRLPFYDCPTSKGELSFFLGLGLAAIAVVAITVLDAARFSNHRQEIADALSEEATTVASATTNNAALTNLAVLRQGSTDERSRLSPIPKPKS